jgi:hypothetical protein
MISPTQRPLPVSTQQSQATGIHAPGGIEPATPATDRSQTPTLDRAATSIDKITYCYAITTLMHTNNISLKGMD